MGAITKSTTLELVSHWSEFRERRGFLSRRGGIR